MNNVGDGGAGASKVTRDVADIVAQIPPIVEALSGVDLTELVSKLPGLSGKQGRKQEPPAGKEA